MSDSFIQVPTDAGGKKVDAETLVIGANTVQRQRVQLVVSSSAPFKAELYTVTNGVPSGVKG